MKLFRILTENKNYANVVEIVSYFFDSFTIIKAEGYWQGNSEHSLIIEIVTDETTSIHTLAYRIKKHNDQQAVMVQVLDIDSKLA